MLRVWRSVDSPECEAVEAGARCNKAMPLNIAVRIFVGIARDFGYSDPVRAVDFADGDCKCRFSRPGFKKLKRTAFRPFEANCLKFQSGALKSVSG